MFDVSELPIPTRGLVRESWVIIFIVWGGVLTVIIVLLGIWLVQESRISAEPAADHHYETLNGSARSTLPYEVMRTPAPSVASMPRAVTYREPVYIDNISNGNAIIYN